MQKDSFEIWSPQLRNRRRIDIYLPDSYEDARRRYPVVFLYRRLINGVGEGHAVIPVRLSRHYVTLLDPLRGERRVTIRKFEEARRLVGRWVVVWEPA